MTVAVLDRWDEPGAPVVLRAEVQAFEAAYFESIWTKFGISREAYVIAAREAVKEARHIFEAKKIVSRNSKKMQAAKRLPGLARWSTVLASFERLLQDYARTGWAVMWGSIVRIAKSFGTNVRMGWERTRILREAGLLKVWQRWEGKDHEYDEGRSNIGFLMVPLEIFEWWTSLPRARRLLASLDRAASDVASPPAEAPPRIAPPSTRSPSTTPAPRKTERQPATTELPTFFPALFHEVRGADPRYLGEDERTGGTMTAENAVVAEAVLRDEAAAARAHCEKHGLRVPDVDVLTLELGRMVVRAWLKESGKDDVLVTRRHAMGLLRYDVARLAVAARTRWQGRQARPAQPVEPVELRDEPRFSVPPPEVDAADSSPPETSEEAEERRELIAELKARLGIAPTAGASSSSEGEPPPAPE